MPKPAATTVEPEGRYDKGAVRIPVAVREYGVGRTLLYELMNQGKLPFSQLTPRMRVIPRSALIELLQKSEVNGPAA